MTETKRNRVLLLLCFLVYTISYIGKYSYSTNIQNVITHFKVSKAYAGYVTSAFFFCYGIGQLINGILCERLNSKWTIALSMGISSGITLVMFFLKNVFVMAVLWGINGLVLSSLWCHCVKLLATIREKSYVTKSVTAMSLTLPVGIVCAYGFSALFTYLDVWRVVYLFSALTVGGIGVAFFFIVGKLQSNGEEKQEISKPEEKQEGGSVFQAFGLLAIPLIVICIGTGLLRDGASTWLPVLLSDTYALPDYFSILLTVGLPLMGVFTAMISARLMQATKSVFGSCLIAGLIAVAVMAALVFALQASFVLLIGLFMLLSLAGYVLGNTLTSILPLYYKNRLKSGQTAGIINACVYIGSTVSTLFLGRVADDFGWRAFMIVLLACALVVLAMAVLGRISKKEKRETE